MQSIINKGVDNIKNIYTPEQKHAVIVRYISGGESSASILADTGMPKSTFYKWRSAYREDQSIEFFKYYLKLQNELSH